MAAIVFFKTEKLDQVIGFYRETFDATVWLEQPDCTILQFENQLIGFCERKEADTKGMITILKPSTEAVDEVFECLEDRAISSPVRNDKYDIYQAFFTDPDGRDLEVQTFLHETDPITW